MRLSGWAMRSLAATIILVSWPCSIAVSAQDPPPAPAEAWSFVIREPSDCAPALARDGTIYFGSFSGKLWALDAEGNKKWVFHARREIKSSPAVGADGTIYFGCRDRSFYAVTPEGKEKWAFKTGAWVDSSPAVDDGAVYFGSWDRSFYALDLNGRLKWQFKTGGPVVSSPAIGRDGTVFFGSHDRKFYALLPDGSKAWEFAAGGAIISSPAIDWDGTVYFTSVDGACHALTAEGASKWRLKTGGITASSPVIGQDGTIYVGVNEKLWAIDPAGKMKWEQQHAGPIETSALVPDDQSVWFISGSGYLINLEVPHQFKWHRFLGGGTAGMAAGAGGTLYAFGHVQNVGQVLYALKAPVSLASSPWPKFRGNPQNTGRAASPP